MQKRRVNISIDADLHDAVLALLKHMPDPSFSGFIEEASREFVVTLTPVVDSAILGNNLHAFALLQVAAARNQQIVTEGLQELSAKFLEEIHTKTVTAKKPKVKKKK